MSKQRESGRRYSLEMRRSTAGGHSPSLRSIRSSERMSAAAKYSRLSRYRELKAERVELGNRWASGEVRARTAKVSNRGEDCLGGAQR